MTNAQSMTAEAHLVPYTLDDIRRLYERSKGKAWLPPCKLDHPRLTELIKRGWLQPCVMRCGFEAMDGGVDWTDAAHESIKSKGA